MAPTPTKEAQAMALEAQRAANQRMAESLDEMEGKVSEAETETARVRAELEVATASTSALEAKITDLETSLAEARNAQTVRELEDEGNGAESAFLREEAEKAKGEAEVAGKRAAAAEKAAGGEGGEGFGRRRVHPRRAGHREVQSRVAGNRARGSGGDA